MSEMALTADHLVVIGRGRLIADATVDEVIRSSSSNHVRVVSPQAAALQALVEQHGASAVAEDGDSLTITGLECRDVGELAAGAGITLHELSPQQASLEEAFMEMTRDSAEFLAESQQSGGGPSDTYSLGRSPEGSVVQ
jgi:ABC-2 type transport system ATP-binding protein